jgi:malate/lactate dehydrogenase
VGAANYEIRIKGRISESLLPAFEGLTVTTEPVETILHGPVPDQEALHELLSKIQSLGLEVVELRRLPAVGPQSDAHTPPSS